MIQADKDYVDKVGKIVASGPAVAIECKYFGDIEAAGDKI